RRHTLFDPVLGTPIGRHALVAVRRFRERADVGGVAVGGLRAFAAGGVRRHGRRERRGLDRRQARGGARKQRAHVGVAAAGGVDDLRREGGDARGDGRLPFPLAVGFGLDDDGTGAAERDDGGADAVLPGQRPGGRVPFGVVGARGRRFVADERG